MIRKYVSVNINILVGLVIIFIYVLLSAQLSSAIDVTPCKDCHGKIEPIPSSQLTKNCLACHDTHGTPKGCCQPTIRDPTKVHDIHKDAGRKVPQQYGGCTNCHKSPVECTNCHNAHGNINFNESLGSTSTVCVNCHGQLPQPTGHENFRDALAENKHQWMNCGTCHLSPYKIPGANEFKFDLHFKDLYKVSINDSINLCKICHSLQYNKLKEGTHGTVDKKCVDCHDPHTTGASVGFQVTPKPTPINISENVENASNWITTKVPILGNPTAVAIMFIIIVVVVAEYILSRHEEGTKIAYNTIKVQANEDDLRTLEVTLKNQNINIIDSTLQGQNINILGMTMKKEKDKDDSDIYKYIVFVDISRMKIKEADIINIFSSVSEIKSVEFTDRYEL